MAADFEHCLQDSACTLEDIEAAHRRLLQQEEDVNIQLDALLSRQCHLEAKLRSVTKALPSLKMVHSDATKLSEMISYTSNLAENVSAKVRKLDLARSRVSECQRRVLDVLDVQLCSEGVSAALRTEDYEKAAAHVHRYLSMDQSLLRQTAEDVAQGTSLWESLKVLQDACSQLREMIVSRFEEAVTSEDVASAERFFKLFPLLGMQDEGLKRFSIYLCSKLKETGEKNLRAVSSRSSAAVGDKRANVAFADTLTLLFEGIARLIEIHQPLVETYYGPGRMLTVVSYLQEECDRQSYQVFLEFNRQRNINQWLKTVRDALKIAASPSLSSSASTSSLMLARKAAAEADGGSGSSSQQQSRPDPRELDILLGEMAIMHARAGLYVRFIRRRVTNDLEVGIIDPAARAEKVKELETHVLGVSKRGGSGLCLAMQELLGNYSLLERYYLEESVAKAIAMDSLIMGGTGEGEGSPPLTSMLDDTFFIIRKCIRRAASSGSLDGTCAILNMACSLLSGSGESGLGATLRRRLRSGYPTSLYLDLSQAYALASSALQSSSLLLQGGVSSVSSGGVGGSGSGGSGSSVDSDRARLMFLAHFNNADIAVDYVETLRQTLLEEIPPTLSMVSAIQLPGSNAENSAKSPLDMLQGNEKAKLESCLVEGLSTVVAELRDLGKIGAHQLSSSAVKPRIAPWVDAFTTHNHSPTEEEFLVLEGEDSFVGGLLSNLSSLLSSFEGSLTPYNFDLFIGMVTSELAARMEKVIFKSQFNRLGGLLLDREVRALTAFLTSKTTGSVRDKFSRLSQIATLLNLEKVSEVSDYWSVGERGTSNTILSWQLSAAEVRKALALRIDFRNDDIKRLKL